MLLYAEVASGEVLSVSDGKVLDLMERLLPLVSKLVESVPMYLLRSGAEKEAAELARHTMSDEKTAAKAADR